MRVRGSNVVVTGATAGIGREVAILLASKGAHVWASGRSGALLKELAGRHPGVTPVEADMTSDADRAALVEAAGPVDVLVNNAGIGWSGLVEHMPAADVRQLFEVNVLGLVDLTQRVLPGMLERRRGHVVNVASVASWVATPPLTVYAATKFAVQGFSDGLGRELAGRGVVVGTVNPGPVATHFWSRAIDEDRPSEMLEPEPMVGVPATTVARAVLRSIRMGGLPGYRTVAVPRLAGLARLGAVPGLRWVVDGGSLLVARSPMSRRER
jgi:short-subunit dehydrogenase